MLYLFRHISLCFSWKSCFEKKMRKNNINYIYFSSNFWGNKFKFKFVALHFIRQGSKDFLLKNNCNNCTWSGRYLAIDVNILNSGSGSRSMENIIDPDPAKWCGSFGSGSGSATLLNTIVVLYYGQKISCVFYVDYLQYLP